LFGRGRSSIQGDVMIVRTPALHAAALTLLFCLAPLVSLVAGGAQDEWKAPHRAAAKPNPIPPDAHSIATGRMVYQKQCQSCHGERGKGDGPAAADLKTMPSDLSDSSLWNESDGELFWKVSGGRKPMPTFSRLLTEEQRWNVINYVRTLAPKPTTRLSNNDADSN
jgi:mono/diheme cytochrome c family protein